MLTGGFGGIGQGAGASVQVAGADSGRRLGGRVGNNGQILAGKFGGHLGEHRAHEARDGIELHVAIQDEAKFVVFVENGLLNGLVLRI